MIVGRSACPPFLNTTMIEAKETFIIEDEPEHDRDGCGFRCAMRCRGESLTGRKTKPLLVKR